VPVQVCRTVTEQQVRKVPHTTCRMVWEDRVDTQNVQVCKMVAVQETVKVPRVVEKRVPVTYTYNVPRVVCCRVPLDACGNPLTSDCTAGPPATISETPAAKPQEPTPAGTNGRHFEADETPRLDRQTPAPDTNGVAPLRRRTDLPTPAVKPETNGEKPAAGGAPHDEVEGAPAKPTSSPRNVVPIDRRT
jgi:hypothetical protein